MPKIEDNLNDITNYFEAMIAIGQSELPDDSEYASKLSELDTMVDRSREALRNHKDMKEAYAEARENLNEAQTAIQEIYGAVEEATEVGQRHEKAFEHLMHDAAQKMEDFMNQTEEYVDETDQNLQYIANTSVPDVPTGSTEVEDEINHWNP